MATTIEPISNKVKIMTERLVLRAAIEEDGELLHEVFHDPTVMQYWSELPHKNIERTKKWVADMTKSPQNGTTDFVITCKEDGKAIGKMGIWQQEEIGFLLNSNYWRQGLAQEALDALLPYFFGERNFEKITADADPDNRACLALLKKIGFEVTGFEKRTFQLGDRWVDSCHLMLKKERWLSLTKRNVAGGLC